MSEYQYYEFQAIDRPLSGADQEALRALSTRARISATSFTNSYEWGDFKGDPARLMENWFELHLYLANWGSRRLMIRWPARLLDRHLLGAFLGEVDYAELRVVGQNLILDIVCEEVESEDWDDGSGWLAALAPLRSDVLGGDLRLFYLLWLTAVEARVRARRTGAHAGYRADDRSPRSLRRLLQHRSRPRCGGGRALRRPARGKAGVIGGGPTDHRRDDGPRKPSFSHGCSTAMRT
jgi:hypothetical protein